MEPEYADHYRKLHEIHWWWRARQAWILEELRRRQPTGGFGAILDVGCGDALFLENLLEFGQPEGLEPDHSIVSPESRGRWTIHLRPFDEQFQPAKRYGLILMLDVLEHLPDEVAALRRARELLTPSGTLLVTVPSFRLLWTAHDDMNHHLTRYTRSTFLRAATQADLEIITMRYFFHWLFFVKLLIRFKENFTGAKPSVPRVPGKAVNFLFHSLTRIEQFSWGRFGLPFGSSMMAVGRTARHHMGSN